MRTEFHTPVSRVLAFVLVAGAGAALAQPQPLGEAFLVNTHTPDTQAFPSVAVDASGGFGIVWTSTGQDGYFSSTRARLYDADGTPRGGEFRVSDADYGYVPAAALSAAGELIVVWQAYTPTDGSFDIARRRFDASGVALEGETRVNSFATGQQSRPALSASADGDFVVAWESYLQDGFGLGIFAQRFAGDGSALGPELPVNTFVEGWQFAPQLAADATGGFVAVWVSGDPATGERDVFARRYDASGTPDGPEFRVNSATGEREQVPDVAADADGNFVVLWASDRPGDDTTALLARRFDAGGGPLASEIVVSVAETGRLGSGAVAMRPGGDFIVVWPERLEPSAPRVLRGRHYAGDGSPAGEAFTIAAEAVGPVDVAMGANGTFVAVWSANADGDSTGVLARRYSIATSLPPDCSRAQARPRSLWPPSRRLHPVSIEGVIDPDGDPVRIEVTSIVQDEGAGSGRFCPDATGIGTSTPLVRAERSLPGDGRVVHIRFVATDPGGSSCTGEATVAVPRSPAQAAIDGGQRFDATLCFRARR